MKTLNLLILETILLCLVFSCEDQPISPPIVEVPTIKSESPIIGYDGEFILDPQQFVREKGKPTVYEVPLVIDNYNCFSEPYYLSIINGDGNGIGAVTSAIISIDGKLIFNQSDFNKKVRDLLANVIINENSILKIELRGKPTTNITASIEGDYKKCNGLYLWNKLGTVEELNNSIFGPNLSTTGIPVFAPAKFDNGVNPSHASQIPTIPSEEFLKFMPNPLLQPWTIELWFKPQYSVENNRISSNIPYGRSHIIVANCWRWGPLNSLGGIRIMPIPTAAGYGIPTDVNADITYYHNDGTYTIIRPDKVVSNVSWDVGDLVHMAAVYDPNGIEGGTIFQFYINGVLHCHSNDTGLNAYDLRDSGWPFEIGGSQTRHAYGVVDNIKIYDYAKTDFSDREIE